MAYKKLKVGNAPNTKKPKSAKKPKSLMKSTKKPAVAISKKMKIAMILSMEPFIF